MNRTVPRLPTAFAAATALCLTLAASGCGLKGALTMPSQSEEIVIRPAPGTTTPAAPQPSEKQVAPPEDRLPPPPLPGGNGGTFRSG